MTSKLLFANIYLKEFNNNDKIQKVIDENKCHVILYKYMMGTTERKNYDHIIITNVNDLKKIIKNNLFDSFKNKLYFIGSDYDYDIICRKYPVLYKIKSKLTIDIFSKIELSNNVQSTHFNYVFKSTNYIPSSIIELDINNSRCQHNKIFCYPNKIKFFVISVLIDKIKPPLNSIFVTKISPLIHSDNKLFNMLFNTYTKNYATFINLSEKSYSSTKIFATVNDNKIKLILNNYCEEKYKRKNGKKQFTKKKHIKSHEKIIFEECGLCDSESFYRSDILHEYGFFDNNEFNKKMKIILKKY
jgi:hypothetical protein